MKKRMIICTLIMMLFLSGCVGNLKDGVALLEAKDYEAARECFQTDISKERNLKEAYRGLGIACFELEEYEEASVAFEKALEYEEEQGGSICAFLGACYIETKEYEKAAKVYEKALTTAGLSAELTQEVRLNLITVYENLAQWDEAKKQMEDAAEE